MSLLLLVFADLAFDVIGVTGDERRCVDQVGRAESRIGSRDLGLAQAEASVLFEGPDRDAGAGDARIAAADARRRLDPEPSPASDCRAVVAMTVSPPRFILSAIPARRHPAASQSGTPGTPLWGKGGELVGILVDDAADEHAGHELGREAEVVQELGQLPHPGGERAGVGEPEEARSGIVPRGGTVSSASNQESKAPSRSWSWRGRSPSFRRKYAAVKRPTRRDSPRIRW